MVVLSYKLFSAHHLTPYAWDIMVIYFIVIWQEVQSGILLKSGTICRDRLVSGGGIVQFKSEQTTTTPLRSYLWYEPPRDKTNKMACATSEDSDQPGHPPSLIRVFAVRMKKASVLSYPLNAQRRLWSDWADAQADLVFAGRTCHFVGFVMRRLIMTEKHETQTAFQECYWHVTL